ncbi:hypothetical protein [uncultured Brevundimonas sp.]|uniref:DUF6950 family protein n=1 Tax=uncultured Brevundimonas sp. TaxID=213418 RepID=UPI002615DC0C|nr:hypothetical protein [uncultured Brevundimonas sp.]
MTHTMVKRVEAVEATIARFNGKPLAYGKDDCARMAYFAIRKHGVKTPILKAGAYSSKVGAARALKRMGVKDVIEAVRLLELPEIAPAAALPGDILALPAEHFGGALMVCVGNGRAFGYFDGKFQVGVPAMFEAAWRSL